jgi:very-short-patch-repair endonuclease
MKPYSNNLKFYAREHRKEGTKGEAVMWKHILRNKKTGYTFNRQLPISTYIVDFVSRKLKLIIEIDGSSHFGGEKSEYDYRREQVLKELGYTIIRFDERDVLKEKDMVGSKIKDVIYVIEQNLKI